VDPFVIVGAGGFAREVLDVADAIERAGGQAPVIGVVTETTAESDLLAARGVEVLGGLEVIRDGVVPFVIGIGDGSARRRIAEDLARCGAASPTLVHPTAILGFGVDLGPGSIVCAHVSITTNVTIGAHTHLMPSCTVGHDCVVGEYVTVSPLAAVSGRVTLEDGATIGTGASIIERLRVGAGAVVGAGAAVIRDVPPGVVAVGVPAAVKGGL
jgi:sugar O-acyltransferase (sialic acid O-acetyltransferase NeuD family)